jgi:flagellar basal-body rod protein FlgB
MDLQSIPFFNVLRTKMGWLEARQQTIAENIANANTPGYKARDLKALDFARVLAGESTGPGMAVTDPRHLKGAAGLADGRFTAVAGKDRETTPDGNSVTLEDEMMRLGETQMSHQAATGLYRKAIEMLRIAVRGA